MGWIKDVLRIRESQNRGHACDLRFFHRLASDHLGANIRSAASSALQRPWVRSQSRKARTPF
jgi:hypothetical protein